MNGERVIERRGLKVDDAAVLARILSRQGDVARDLVRAWRTGDPEEGAAAFVRALAVLPDLLPWIASIYGVDEATVRAEPMERLLDYIEGLVKGDDWTAFFRRLQLFIANVSFTSSLSA
jgi:hypothetical protein